LSSILVECPYYWQSVDGCHPVKARVFGLWLHSCDDVACLSVWPFSPKHALVCLSRIATRDVFPRCFGSFSHLFSIYNRFLWPAQPLWTHAATPTHWHVTVISIWCFIKGGVLWVLCIRCVFAGSLMVCKALYRLETAPEEDILGRNWDNIDGLLPVGNCWLGGVFVLLRFN